MRRLHGLRHNTAVLTDNTRAEYLGGLKRSGKKVFITIAVIAVAALAILIIAKVSSNYSKRDMTRRIKQEEAFQADYYPELDRIYESGDYDALLSYAYSLSEKPGSGALYSWDHYEWLSIYEKHTDVAEAREAFDAGTAEELDYRVGVYAALSLTRMEETSQAERLLSESEKEKLSAYIDEAEAYLEDVLREDSEGVDEFYESILGKYGPEYDIYTKVLHQRLSDLNII